MQPDVTSLLRVLMLAICVAVPAPVWSDAAPLFQPVDIPHHVYSGGWEHYVGGGLAAFDCNSDGLPELFAAGGATPASLLRNRSVPGREIVFDRQTPDSLALRGVIGAYPLDIDSDGWLDLVVLRVGPNLLLQGGPDCSFATFPALDIGDDARWTTAFSATWETGQSLPTLAFGNYVDRSNPDGPFRACDSNQLLRPQGDRYGAAIPLDPGFCPLSMLFSDWGRNGRADLRISNDRHYYVDDGQEQLWAMGKVPSLYAPADGWATHRLWGMGIAARDLDADGRPEVYLTSMGDQRLQRLASGAPGPTYEDVPYAMGTTGHRPYTGGDGRPSTGWHVAFGDVQNDGRDDIFVAKGNVEQMPDSAMADPNSLLVQGADGNFTETGEAAGIASLHRGRGAALVDLNADGLLDLAVVNRRAALEVYRNITPDPGHWLALDLSQPAPNVNAVGGWIELDAGGVVHAREITVGGGHAGGAAVPEHFGLGAQTDLRVRVIWPDGVTSDWRPAPPDQVLRLVRGAGARLDLAD